MDLFFTVLDVLKVLSLVESLSLVEYEFVLDLEIKELLILLKWG